MMLTDVIYAYMYTSCSLVQVWNCAMEVLKGHVLSGEYVGPGRFMHSLIPSIPTQLFVYAVWGSGNKVKSQN